LVGSPGIFTHLNLEAFDLLNRQSVGAKLFGG